MDPLANENAGGVLGQFTGAQHAVTVALSVTETALVHLATRIPAQNRRDMNTHTGSLYRFFKMA